MKLNFLQIWYNRRYLHASWLRLINLPIHILTLNRLINVLFGIASCLLYLSLEEIASVYAGFRTVGSFGRGWDLSYAEDRGFEDGHHHAGISLSLPDL